MQRVKPVAKEDWGTHSKEIHQQLILPSESPESEHGPDRRDEIDRVQQACLSAQEFKKVSQRWMPRLVELRVLPNTMDGDPVMLSVPDQYGQQACRENAKSHPRTAPA